MVKCEYLETRSDGVILVKTSSTDNKMLYQKETGLLMIDPIDVGDRYFDEVAFEVKYKPKFYTYIESETDIPEENKE